jgi:hypothetical protein
MNIKTKHYHRKPASYMRVSPALLNKLKRLKHKKDHESYSDVVARLLRDHGDEMMKYRESVLRW